MNNTHTANYHRCRAAKGAIKLQHELPNGNKSKFTTTNRAELEAFAQAAINGTLPPMPSTWCFIRLWKKKNKKTGKIQLFGDGRHTCDMSNTWASNYRKFATFMLTGIPQFSIFNPEGNSKLKFYAFSSLPGIDCPGAGACLSFCYSFKAWRYPSAFFRQLQNSILVRQQSQYIRDEFDAIPHGKTIRLYVDGDHDSSDTLEFWFDLLRSRPDLEVYGYSKSWDLFTTYKGNFPVNYTLNLSSGSRWAMFPDMKRKMLALPITRGEFVAVKSNVPMPKEGRANLEEWKPFMKAVKALCKELGYGNVFVCPGKCFDCMPNGEHACGNKSINVPVAIGIH